MQTVSVGDNIRTFSGSDIFIQSLEYTQPLDEVSTISYLLLICLDLFRFKDNMRNFLETHRKDPSSGIIDFTCMYYNS